MPRKPISSQSFKVLLLISDLGAIIALFNLAYFFRLGELPHDYLLTVDFTFVVFSLLGMSYVFDLYAPDSQISGLRAPGRCWLATAVAAGLIALYLYLSGERAANLFGRGVMTGALTFYALWTSLMRLLVARWLRQRAQKLRWLAIGNYNFLKQFWEDFCSNRIQGQICFLIDPKDAHLPVGDMPIVDTCDELDKWLLRGWSGIVVCTENKLSEDKLERLLHVRLLGMRVYNLTDFYESIWFKVPVYFLDRSWLALTQGFGLLHNTIGLRFKRVADFTFALLLLPIGLPIILLSGILIVLESGLPMFFQQVRTGKDGKPFTIFKLRTMRKDAEANGAQWSLHSDRRITYVGRCLRKFRIDELPQIWNVLRGDMSFIGPRPERPEFNHNLERQIPHYNLRHVVRPGITGWAQVLYRYGSSISDSREKLQYDLYYIKNYSILMDIAIVLKTFRALLLGAGR